MGINEGVCQLHTMQVQQLHTLGHADGTVTTLTELSEHDHLQPALLEQHLTMMTMVILFLILMKQSWYRSIRRRY